jgi:hypothetical protein
MDYLCTECNASAKALDVVWIREEDNTVRRVCTTCAIEKYDYIKCCDCDTVLPIDECSYKTEEEKDEDLCCDECWAKYHGYYMHACGSYVCDGRCGVMWCGCIDVCRCYTDRLD